MPKTERLSAEEDLRSEIVSVPSGVNSEFEEFKRKVLMFRKPFGLVLSAVVMLIPAVATAGLQDLENARQKGLITFAVVYESGTSGVEEAKSLAGATADKFGEAAVVEIDRSQPLNTAFLANYRLSTAPVPLIMVFSGSGILSGVMPAGGRTSDDLIHLVPSPKKEEVLKALLSRKSVFITAMSQEAPLNESLSKNCMEACNRLNGKAVYVKVDLNDEKESSFLQQLRVDPKSSDPVTVVINTRGQVTGSYTGLVETAILVSSATQAGGGGCCGPGSNKSCAVPQ